MYSRNENGFALIELIIALIVMMFVVLGSYAFQSNMQEISKQSTARYEMQSEGNVALRYMSRILEQANASDGIGDCHYYPGYPPDNPSCDGSGECGADVLVYTPAQDCTLDCNKSYDTQWHFWANNWITGGDGNLYLERKKPSGYPKQVLIGDYDDGKFGIKVLKLDVKDQSKRDVYRPNTVSIDLALGLINLTTNSTVESMHLQEDVHCRNRQCY